MTRRIPILPTIVVVVGIVIMISLGLWQLQRAKWKEGLLARYHHAENLPPITFPTMPLRDDQLPLFRYASGNCLRPVSSRAVAGENAHGDPGYVHIFDCVTGAEGPGMTVQLGWSRDPNAKVAWNGGLVSGIIVPDNRSRMRLVALGAPPGLEPSKVPDARSASPITPAGHRGYAATWFSLAAAAFIIYVLAMRKRWREGQRQG